MPPKKALAEKKTLLGRPSNNLKIGIVGLLSPNQFSFIRSHFFPSSLGLPNVGKSSFFNALSDTGMPNSITAMQLNPSKLHNHLQI
jgi:obg-like ATPase 1